LADPSFASVNVRFVLLGDGHLREELQSQAQRLGISHRVAFAGFRDDALKLYADFDVVALTSLNEGTPLTLIEAMASGCAVAATEVGGVIDIMGSHRATQDGFSIWDHGVTAPSRDVEGFARALRFLIERPALRQGMGRRGREFVKSRLSKERLIGDMEKLYFELVGLEAEPSRKAVVAVRS
jgi:glycosyltransferase involved in cell wall biosynthesis